MRTMYSIVVGSDGTVRFTWDDRLRPFASLGKATAMRASHVEPEMVGGSILWTADMEPVGGPVLGPYADRERALQVERDWLRQNGF